MTVLEENVKLFKENDWDIVTLPSIQTEKCHCLCRPGPYITGNMLSLGPNTVIIE